MTCLHCWLWADFTYSCRVSIVGFEQVNAEWEQTEIIDVTI